jgi:hypothetical protein
VFPNTTHAASQYFKAQEPTRVEHLMVSILFNEVETSGIVQYLWVVNT